MCTSKTPKTQKVEEKQVQYLSNPWADGLGIAGTFSRGRNSLRNDAPNAHKNPAGSNAALVPERPTFTPSGGGGLSDWMGNNIGSVMTTAAQAQWDMKYGHMYETQIR